MLTSQSWILKFPDQLETLYENTDILYLENGSKNVTSLYWEDCNCIVLKSNVPETSLSQHSGKAG